MKKKKSFRDEMILMAKDILPIIRLISIKLAQVLISSSTKLKWVRASSRRNPRYVEMQERVFKNMKEILNKKFTDAQIKILTKKHTAFQAVLDNALKIVKHRKFALESCWKFENLHYLDEALTLKRGAILVTAHFGYTKFLKYALMKKGYCARLVRQKKSEKKIKQEKKELKKHTKLYQYLYHKLDVFVNHDPADPLADLNLKPVLQCLKRNEIIIALADAVHASKFIYYPILENQVVPITTGVHSLAYGSGAPILPVFIVDRNDGREIIFKFYPPQKWRDDSSALKKEKIQYACQEFAESFKEHVESRPDLYVPAWIRDRFFERRKSRSKQDISKRY